MKLLIQQALSGAMQRLKAHAVLVGLSNVDESTFRSFFMAAMKQRHRGAKFQTEWHHFDLLLRCGASYALVEFKFYLMRQTRELDGSLGSWKGGAGRKNEREFKDCLDKLHKWNHPALKHKYAVLVYEKAYPRQSGCSFAKSYDILAPGSKISTVTDVPHCMAKTLTCKLLIVS